VITSTPACSWRSPPTSPWRAASRCSNAPTGS
jgi:hypothetical protein